MIELIDLKKQFNNKWISNGVNLKIPENQMTVIIGKSGEGKSVLLKQIIGLVPPTSGKIIIEGKDTVQMNKSQRVNIFKKFGYVFQFAALLDSLNVFENIGLQLLEDIIPKNKILEIVKEKLKLVNLPSDILWKYPSELSGGMRKRVGLARTLITQPQTILYDEPTTGLDPITVRIIHELMYDMQKRFKITSIVVSHDIEIFKYADNVALLHEGKIRYFGNAKTIWQSDNPYVYQFIRGLSEGPMQTEIVSKSN
ncbi:MAG: ATP-binding cassette domain-containing protein [Candidatus Babeliales bacterium]